VISDLYQFHELVVFNFSKICHCKMCQNSSA